MQLKRTYSSREVAAITGLSARQLQLWDESGLLTPAIPPHRTTRGGYTERRYTPIELFELIVLGELRRHGFSAHQLHAIVDTLAHRFSTRLFDATGGGARLQLLTDGKQIYARTSTGELYNLLNAPGQPLLVIGEEASLKELRARVRNNGKRQKVKGQ